EPCFNDLPSSLLYLVPLLSITCYLLFSFASSVVVQHHTIKVWFAALVTKTHSTRSIGHVRIRKFAAADAADASYRRSDLIRLGRRGRHRVHQHERGLSLSV